MKNGIILFVIASLLVFNACSAPEEVYPEDLKGRKALLKEKNKELKELSKLVAKLEADIEEEEPTKEKPRTIVSLDTVERSNFNRFVDIQATVQSYDGKMASSETGGRIIKMDLDEGDYVKKGQLIAKTDMESVDKQIAELEKSLELAVDVYERQKRLWDQNIGSEMQFLQAKNNKERLEKSLESVRFQTTKANVYAPLSGVIDRVFAKQGEMAGPGAPIVQIVNNSTVRVVADVPEAYLGKIRKGQTVSVNFPALDLERTGKVSELGRNINPANRTFNVEVYMNNKSGTLKPNLLATMMIEEYSEKDVVILPLELVQQQVDGRNYVYILEEGDEGAFAKKVYVETGESYQNSIIVTDGLKGGEQLIVDGARNIAENDLIKVNTPKG